MFGSTGVLAILSPFCFFLERRFCITAGFFDFFDLDLEVGCDGGSSGCEGGGEDEKGGEEDCLLLL